MTFPATLDEIEAEVTRRAGPLYTGRCAWERRKSRELRDHIRQQLQQQNANAIHSATRIQKQSSTGIG